MVVGRHHEPDADGAESGEHYPLVGFEDVSRNDEHDAKRHESEHEVHVPHG